MPIALVVLILVVGAFTVRVFQKRKQRAALLASGLSDRQKEIIAEQVPLVSALPDDMHRALEGKINLFLDQVNIVGCNDLEVTEEMELSIAAQACFLIVNVDAWYTHLTTFLVYPGAFKSKTQSHDGYVVREEEVVRTGESWWRGPVILSWQHSQMGAANSTDGHNVVLHEFAHQFDDLSGRTNGQPLLGEGQSYAAWERVVVAAYERHEANVMQGRCTAMDGYGATNHAEFFAVAVETFFERPAALQAEEPEVYEQLTELLRLDPLTWQGQGAEL